MKLFSRSVLLLLSLMAITAVAPLASGQNLYYQGGIKLNNEARSPSGPGDQDFDNPDNWSTVPPNTSQTGGTNAVPGPSNVAIIQADLNNGTVFYTSTDEAFISNNPAVTVVVNQTTQANTVAGFIVSNYGFVGQGSGTVNFNNLNNQTFTVNGSNAAGGDFVVDGGVTLNYTGGPFVVSKGTIIIGDDTTFETSATTNTVGGAGTFNIISGSFNFDTTAANATQMVVGSSNSGVNEDEFLGTTSGTVTQGAPATAAIPASGTTPATSATAASSSVVTTGSSLIIGQNSSSGAWNVTNGSTLQTGTHGSSYFIALGSNGLSGGGTGTRSQGTLTISDSSVFSLGFSGSTNATDLQLGTVSSGAGAAVAGGTGSIIQNGATSTVSMSGTNTTVDIGSLGGGIGTYSISGGALNIGTNATDNVAFTLGATTGSLGTLNQTGGSITVGNSGVANGTTFVIGGAGPGTGVFNFSGGTDTFNNTVTLNGTLNLNGGTFSISQDNLPVTGTGTLNLGGGTLKFTGGAATTYEYSFQGALTQGTSTIDASTAGLTTFTFAQPLTGAGGINLIGGGATVFNFASNANPADVNTYTGSTGISGGTLNAVGADLSSALAGSSLIFGSSGQPGTLNLTLSAPTTTLQQAVTGTGTFNIDYGAAGAPETLFLSSSANSASSVNLVLGANGTAGGLEVAGGSYGTVTTGAGAEGSTVTIGGGITAGSVTFGATTYTGLTTIDSGYSLTAPNINGSVVNMGTLNASGQVSTTGHTVMNDNGAINAGSIVGDVTNTSTGQFASTINTASITGDVTNTGAGASIVSPLITGNILANSGTITAIGGGITGNVGSVGTPNAGTVTASTVGGAVFNSGTFIGASALGATTVNGNVNSTGVLASSTALPTTAAVPPPGPANPAMATFTSNGNIISSGTLTVRVNTISSDSYFANGGGASAVSGHVKLSGFGNNRYTIFTAANGGTVTYDPATIINSTTLFTGSITDTGSTLVLTTTQVASASFSKTTTQRNVAMAIDSYLSGANAIPASALSDFNTFNNIYSNLPIGEFPAAQEQLSPEVLQYARNIAFENATYLAMRVNGVDADLREGYEGLDTNAVSIATPGLETGLGRSLTSMLAYNDPGFHNSAPNGVNYYPGEAGRSSPSPSADSTPATFDSSNQVISDSPNPYLANTKPGSDETPRLNEFIGGDVILADLNQNNGQGNAPVDKASYTAGDVTAGISFRVTNHFAAGVLFDYNHTDADVDSNGSKIKVDTYSPGIFATYFDHGFYANGLFSFGYNNYKNTINQPIFGTTATSSPSGQQYVTDLDVGYDFHPDKNWVVGPTLGGTYTHLDIDSIQETGAALANLGINSQSEDSFRSRLGGHVTYQTNTGDVLLQPTFTAMWQHEFLADSDNIVSDFSELGGASTFDTPTVAPSRDSALIGVGLTATLNNSMALYLNYLADVGADNFFSQSVVGGLKARF
jgi:uncharacterized protein YhjY with autotransporter beta-barrel domain